MKIAPYVAAAALSASVVLYPSAAQASGAVCLTDTDNRSFCIAGYHPSTTYVPMTVASATNASHFAVNLKPGWICLSPGESRSFPGGYAINVVEVGPGTRCAW